jgi:NAD(P)-dependent dehydrogenase (short-subunit alcohol dehydrogenase family)
MHDLTNRVVLLTGIGSFGPGWGNGRAIATLFARQGAHIFGCDISLPAAAITRTMILAENPHATVDIMAGDVTSSASMRAFVDACMQRHGRVDVLVNNVGAQRFLRG